MVSEQALAGVLRALELDLVVRVHSLVLILLYLALHPDRPLGLDAAAAGDLWLAVCGPLQTVGDNRSASSRDRIGDDAASRGAEVRRTLRRTGRERHGRRRGRLLMLLRQPRYLRLCPLLPVKFVDLLELTGLEVQLLKEGDLVRGEVVRLLVQGQPRHLSLELLYDCDLLLGERHGLGGVGGGNCTARVS